MGSQAGHQAGTLPTLSEHDTSATTPRTPRGRPLALLSLGALGVVYGDIGTSPLYALRESLHPEAGVAVTPESVLGVLSLIFWALIIVITVKYLMVVMRADQEGEGGILVLTSLISARNPKRRRRLMMLIGLFGTALLFGDGMITPAISVLSAVEGLEISVPSLGPYVLAITAVILVALFAIQRSGTAAVGRVFGPVMVVWFVTLGILGAVGIAGHPDVLRAVSPSYAIGFFVDHGFQGFLTLGAVVLVVTGGEALYADMGHFGRRPIQVAWYAMVLPGLLLNYFGQGALILEDPSAVESPFYLLAPAAARLPLTVLATMAAVIASQALISGAFSLATQSALLGYLPRLRVEHTSARLRGQVYVPTVNWTLLVCCLALVFGFGSSSGLAAAYGVAVTTTMVIDTSLFALVARERFRWPIPAVASLTLLLLVVDLSFFGANLFKIPSGGWFPLVIGAVVFTVMTTWKTGKQLVGERLREGEIPLRAFVDSLASRPPRRVPGTAVYLYRHAFSVPPILVASLRLRGVLHQEVVLLSIEVARVPRVHPRRALEVHHLGHGISQAILRVGYMQQPNVPRALEADAAELRFHPLDTYYFLGRDTILVTERPGMARWRERLFAVMSRNTRSAVSYYGIPPGRAIEIGLQVEL